MYYKRNIEETINRMANQFACITIYGSRQVGKSTLVDYLFSENIKHISLDDTFLLSQALENPKIFIEDLGWPLIIDEIQKAPILLSEIKKKIDEQKLKCLHENKKIQLMYILTGSNQFELQKQITESLTGRNTVCNLASFSFNEIKQIGVHGFFSPNIDVLKEKEKK